MRRSQSGLTLIELIVAVALLALLTVMAYRGLDSMTRANDRTLAETERWRATRCCWSDSARTCPSRRAGPCAGPAGTPLPAWWGRAMTEPDGRRRAVRVLAQVAARSGRIQARLPAARRQCGIAGLARPGPRARFHGGGVPAARQRARAARSGISMPKASGRTSGRMSDAEPLPRAVSIELTLAEGPSVKRIFALP